MTSKELQDHCKITRSRANYIRWIGKLKVLLAGGDDRDPRTPEQYVSAIVNNIYGPGEYSVTKQERELIIGNILKSIKK